MPNIPKIRVPANIDADLRRTLARIQQVVDSEIGSFGTLAYLGVGNGLSSDGVLLNLDASASDVANNSSVTGATVKDALETLENAIGSVDLSLSVTGVLPVTNGGTGAATLTGYVKGNGTSAMTASATIPNTDITGLGSMSVQDANNVAITGGSATGLSNVGTINVTNFFGSEITLGVASRLNATFVRATGSAGVQILNQASANVATFGANGLEANFKGIITSSVPSGNTAMMTLRGAFVQLDNETAPMRLRSNASSANTIDVLSGTDVIAAFNRTGTLNKLTVNGAFTKSDGGDMTVATTSDANALFVQDSNGRVGVGTNAPSSKLHVVGTQRIESSGLTSHQITRQDNAVLQEIFVASSAGATGSIPIIQMARSRGTIASQTEPKNNDVIGMIGWATRSSSSNLRVASQYVQLTGQDGPGVMHFRMAATSGANSYTTGNFVLSLYPDYAELLQGTRTPTVRATSSSGLVLQNQSGTAVLTLGASSGTNALFAGGADVSGRLSALGSFSGTVTETASNVTLSASSFVVYVNTDLSARTVTFLGTGLPIGQFVAVLCKGTFGLTLAAGSGVTIEKNPGTISPGESAVFVLAEENLWYCLATR